MFDLGELGAAVTLNDSAFVNTLGGIENKAKMTFGRIAKYAAGVLGFTGITSFLRDSVRAFIAQEDAVDGLNDALRRVGAGKESANLQKFAKEMQKVTTIGDAATLSVMALGVNMGIEVKQMEDATKAAMGLADAYGLDLNNAMQLVAKANMGNTKRLEMLDKRLQFTGTKQENFNKLLKEGGDLFQYAKAETFGQRLQQLGNAWGNLKVQVGDFFLTLTGFYDSTDGLTKTIQGWTDTIQKNIDVWTYKIQLAFSIMEAILKVMWALVEPLFSYLKDSLMDFGANVASLFTWIVTNFESLTSNIPKILISMLEGTIDALKKTMKMGSDLLVNVTKTLFDVILGYYKMLWEKLKAYAEMIVNVGGNIAKAIKGIFTGEGIGGFKEVWEGIKTDFDNLMSGGIEIKTDNLKKTFEDLKTDFKDAFVANFEKPVAALGEIASPLPTMQKTASLDKMIEAYKEFPDKAFEIWKETEQKQANLYDEFEQRLNNRNKQNENGTAIDKAAEAGKGNVAGSFSAAILNAMIGSNSPQKETAKNTRQMVEQQKETNQKLAENGLVYT